MGFSNFDKKERFWSVRKMLEMIEIVCKASIWWKMARKVMDLGERETGIVAG